MDGLYIAATDVVEVESCLAQLACQLFPVVRVHAVVVLALLLVVQPFFQAVEMNEPDGADAFARSNERVLECLLFIKTNTAALVIVIITLQATSIAQSSRHFRCESCWYAC